MFYKDLSMLFTLMDSMALTILLVMLIFSRMVVDFNLAVEYLVPDSTRLLSIYRVAILE